MLNVAQFISDKFGDTDGLLRDLETHVGKAPSHWTARKWTQRNSIPSDWLVMCLLALERRDGGPLSIATFVAGAMGAADAEPQSVFD